MLKNIFIALNGTLVAQAIGFALLPFLTRTYSPAEFGVYQIYLSSLTLATVASGLKYELALLTANRDGEDCAVFQLCITTNLITSLVLGLVGLGVASIYSQLSYTMLLVFVAGVLAAGLAQTLGNILLREDKIALSAICKIGQISLFCLVGLGLGKAGFQHVGMIIGDLLGRTFVVLLVFAWLVKVNSVFISVPSISKIAEVARKFRKYPMLAAPGALLNQGTSSIVPVLMAIAFGQYVTGQYSLVERVVLVPAALISQSIAMSYSVMLSSALRAGTKIVDDYRKLVLIMAAIATVPSLIVALGAPKFFDLFFGSNWTIAGQFAQVMGFALFSSLIMTPVNVTLVVIGCQIDQFVWETSRLVLIGFLWFIIFEFNVSSLAAVGLISAAAFIANISFVALAYYRLARMDEGRES